MVPAWTYASALQEDVVFWSALSQSGLLTACALGAGVSMRMLGERTRQLADLTGRLRREKEAAAARAVTRERVRIARELHDVIACHMSVISVQAGMGRFVALSDPVTARAALNVIADTSHDALSEMRRLLSILRIEAHDENEGVFTTETGLQNVDVLAERMRASGLPLKVEIEGQVQPLAVRLPDRPGIADQRAQTRRARLRGGPYRVRPTSLTVRITDDGAGLPTLGNRSGGHGLISMTERVSLYRGTITAGRLPQGGYEVLAMFPLPPPE
ncbi:sensor histidine kinase [Nonomuraea purpurea]|uniref:histidine kinase n=1 Tax=Nonomuraea purpurea TaxID=1849276 RepID=A0ABV8GR98_9ACTN